MSAPSPLIALLVAIACGGMVAIAVADDPQSHAAARRAALVELERWLILPKDQVQPSRNGRRS